MRQVTVLLLLLFLLTSCTDAEAERIRANADAQAKISQAQQDAMDREQARLHAEQEHVVFMLALPWVLALGCLALAVGLLGKQL